MSQGSPTRPSALILPVVPSDLVGLLCRWIPMCVKALAQPMVLMCPGALAQPEALTRQVVRTCLAGWVCPVYLVVLRGLPVLMRPGFRTRTSVVAATELAVHLLRVAREQESFHGPASGWGTVLAAPVIANETTMGVLWIARHAPEPFPEADLRLFLSIANLVAIALDRVSLNEDAVRQARELAARNGELDRFAYVVSHDLKEPLIAIEGYTKIVLSGKANVLDEVGRNHLGSVVRSTGRMKQLIDDLLTLSRLDRVPGQVDTIEVPLLLEELLNEMAFTLRERNARVEYEPALPAVRYDATHLTMVFRNLISNGVKFNSSAEPLVRISAEEKPDGIVFSVADNGIGIPKEEAEKVFVIFHRLHPAERYAGTGAGLTIVKKIVEAYGGRIWLESSPGQGSTFHFSVPHHV